MYINVLLYYIEQFILFCMKVLPVLYENSEILVVNKPAGLAVQGGEQVKHPLDEILAVQTGCKVYPVHRLDKDTAGILIVAKNSRAAGKWTGVISSGAAVKQYTAVCVGIPPGITGWKPGFSGIFSEPVGKGSNRKPALTKYHVIKTARIPCGAVPPDGIQSAVLKTASGASGIPGNGHELTVSLLELTLGTGRMHQIRIHLAGAGCPIVADDKYGCFPWNRLLKRCFGIRELQLAAVRLTVPVNGKNRTFSIALPDHMIRAEQVLFQTAARQV